MIKKRTTKKSQDHKKVFIGIAVLIIFFVTAIIANRNSPHREIFSSIKEASFNECNVAQINMRGEIIPYLPPSEYDNDGNEIPMYDAVSSEAIVQKLEDIKYDDAISAVLLTVDSPGGYPVPAEEIAEAVQHAQIPVVALVRSIGTSAAYWAISSSDHIIASKNSDVGSIGVTSSYLENKHPDQKFIEIASGKYKDYGNPDKTLTEDEKNIILRDVKIIHENFMDAIAKNRNIARDLVVQFSDGASVLGEKALEIGLIDQIGGIYEAKDYLRGLIKKEPVICEY